MKILPDTADIIEIKRYTEYYDIDGVTTNPGIIAKEGNDFISDRLVDHSFIQSRVEQFTNDWTKAYDNKTSMKEMLI